MTEVIKPQVAAATYNFYVPDGQVWQFTGSGFSGADSISLQARTSQVQERFANYVDSSGTTPALSSSNNSLQVVGPFAGRWSKGETTGSVGLEEFK